MDTTVSTNFETPEMQPAASTEQPHYIGFWKRFFAYGIDWLWMYIVARITTIALVITGSLGMDTIVINNSTLALQFLIPFFITLLFWKFFAATPGKMLFRAIIVDADTLQPVPLWRLALRYLGYVISTVTLLVGFFWAGFDKHKQGFHDKIASTVVIKKPPKNKKKQL